MTATHEKSVPWYHFDEFRISHQTLKPAEELRPVDIQAVLAKRDQRIQTHLNKLPVAPAYAGVVQQVLELEEKFLMAGAAVEGTINPGNRKADFFADWMQMLQYYPQLPEQELGQLLASQMQVSPAELDYYFSEIPLCTSPEWQDRELYQKYGVFEGDEGNYYRAFHLPIDELPSREIGYDRRAAITPVMLPYLDKNTFLPGKDGVLELYPTRVGSQMGSQVVFEQSEYGPVLSGVRIADIGVMQALIRFSQHPHAGDFAEGLDEINADLDWSVRETIHTSQRRSYPELIMRLMSIRQKPEMIEEVVEVIPMEGQGSLVVSVESLKMPVTVSA